VKVKVQERVAIVTGAGSGIGAATALALSAENWRVVLAGRRREALQAVADRDGVGRMRPVSTDVTEQRPVRALFEEAVDAYGRVDLVFNNAGRSAPALEIDALSLTDWQAVVAVNLTGTFLCTREAFRVMRSQRPQGGRIINNGSISAQVPRPMSAAYTATKHAVSGLTKSTSLDGRPYNIACGQIDVGNASTEMTDRMTTGVRQADGTVRPEPRMAVEDVARAVVYMASLPLDTNVANMTVLATTMRYVGRG
jgi:NAD(P)-dependent dehydrogenase (short-subunit alcohol dehydrogenase family)